MSDSSTILAMPARPGQLALTVTAGPHSGLSVLISGPDSLLVGRGEQADLRLEDDSHFSRNHFLLKANPPECVLVELGSRNGTFLNSKRVQEAPLADGDEIGGGATRIHVAISVAPKPAGWEPVPSSDGTPPVSPGDSIGAYTIVRELGRGAMGVVYLARHHRTGRDVALKMLRPSAQAPQEAMQLFIREASVLSQLNHRSIVRFHEFGLFGQQLFLAMEYVDTASLLDLMEKERTRRKHHLACGLACQMLAGLAYAHDRGLVHRDIKPANLLVTRQNRRAALKVADFGLAKSYWNAGCSGVTAEGTMRGTLIYMAPEQVVHCRDANPACDIYSAAATLYWMLTGRAPVRADTPGAALKAILEDSPTPLSELRPDLPAELSGIVHRGLDKVPAGRFSSSHEFRHALIPFARP